MDIDGQMFSQIFASYHKITQKINGEHSVISEFSWVWVYHTHPINHGCVVFLC